MIEPKEKEALILNAILCGLAVIVLGVAVYTAATNMFKAGTDDLFLIMTCLLLALLFAINPLIWAYSKGWISNPFKADELEGGEAALAHHGASNRQNIFVWGGLLVLTGIEVGLAYRQLNLNVMLFLLMGLSIIKAGLIIAYFMHMKFERASFILTIVPTLIILLCLFAIFFPDSFRLHEMRPETQVTMQEKPE